MTRLAVLAGGPSCEHEVSLQTGANMLALLRARGHSARPVFIDREGTWRFGGQDATLEAAAGAAGERLATPEAIAALRAAGEVAVLALHGRFGEDGQLAAALEEAGVPFTGSGSHASAIGMDKELSKLAATRVGARCATHEVVSGPKVPVNRLLKLVGLPCVAKPVRGGSSVGVSIVRTEADLEPAVRRACAEDERGSALVEAFVPGTEATCAVLRVGGEVRTLPVVAIRPEAGFYDYEAKYLSDRTRFECPAALPEEALAEMRRVSLALHAGLELRGVARVDFLVREGDGAPVFLELNTLPGFTGHSLVPLAARAAGLDPGEILEAALADALAATGREAPA